MNLWQKLKDRFAPAKPQAPDPPTLRNRPGGLAWINSSIDCGEGSIALVNRIVRTTALLPDGMWVIEPEQPYVLTKHARFNDGEVFEAGRAVRSIAIKDECLTPMPGITDDETTEEQGFQPPVPLTGVGLTPGELDELRRQMREDS
jgi:hypothetical protein